MLSEVGRLCYLREPVSLCSQTWTSVFFSEVDWSACATLDGPMCAVWHKPTRVCCLKWTVSANYVDQSVCADRGRPVCSIYVNQSGCAILGGPACAVYSEPFVLSTWTNQCELSSVGQCVLFKVDRLCYLPGPPRTFLRWTGVWDFTGVDQCVLFDVEQCVLWRGPISVCWGRPMCALWGRPVYTLWHGEMCAIWRRHVIVCYLI